MKNLFLRMKRALSAVLLVLLLSAVGMTKGFAYDFSKVCSTGQTLYYDIIDATNHYVEMTYPGTSSLSPWNGYTKPTGNITLPFTVTYNGNIYTVKRIGDYAFDGCFGLTGSLSIPNSVTTIGYAAFSSCTCFTGTLTLPNSLTEIGMFAFQNCYRFTGSLTIPNSVTSIGNYAFYNCYGFTGTLIIPNSVTEIGMYAFENCSGFTSMRVYPETPPTLEEGVFYDVPKTIPVTVSCGTLSAYQSASGWNEFTNIQQAYCDPDPLIYSINADGVSVTVTGHMDGTAASGELIIPETKTIDGVTYTVTAIGNDAFYGCTGLTGSLTIPHAVTTIGSLAFYNCSGFTGSLVIPNSVTEIGLGAFIYCSGFTGSLTIGNSVTSIGDYAFSSCSGFTQVNFNAVNCADVSPESHTFDGCGGTLVIGGSVQRIPACMFYRCSGFTGSLTIPNSVTEIGEGAFVYCSGFTGSLTIGNSVTSIDDYTFYSCSGFTGSLTIPNSVTTIGSSAFYNCSGFTQVNFNAINCADVAYDANPFKYCGGTLTIGGSVQRIPACMFYECSGFTGSLTIPNSVTEIGEGAFANCSGFTGSLTIGNSVTSIDDYTFYSCSGFTGSLTIPNSVTTIGSSAFYNCSGFTQVNFNAVNCADVAYDANPFKYCGSTLTIGGSVQRIPACMFYGCSGFTGSLTLPNSVAEIGDYAFSGCSGFTGSLTIGTGVTSIGQGAFRYCAGFASMTVYLQTPPTLGSDVFFYVPTTIPVYVFCSSLEGYQAAAQWSAFTNMQCIHETLTVYDGTVTNNHIPAYIYYFDEFTKSQFVIPADDLADMTGTPINSMTFYTTGENVPYTTVSSADVYLKEVNYTNISAFEPKTSATTVYSGYLDIVSTGNGGEMTINFSTPYTYNGGNLLVGIENTETNGWKIIYFHGKHVSEASVSGSSSSSLESVQPVQQNFIPKTTFGYTPTECSRPVDLTATDITSNSAMLNWTGFQDEYDVRYRTKPLFFEDFEHGLPSGWTTIDNDGDGYNWHHYSNNVYNYAHSGTHLMGSASWQEGTALTPDNWLVTPLLQLQGTMKVWLSANSSAYQDEHFAIYLSTTGNNVSDFTTVLVPETVTSSEYVCYTADLSAYAGQQGYIAIRHFNCTDMDRLRLDDFGIYDDLNADEWELALSTNNQLLIGNLEPDTEYEWQVRGRDCEGSGTFTEWSAAQSFTTKCEAFVVDVSNPFTEDFEVADFSPVCWENIPFGNYQWRSDTDQSHSSSHSAFSGWYGDIYLVLPDLELSADAEAVQLSFWSYNSYPSDFAVGNNKVVLLDGGTETVLWSAEMVSQEWVETIVDLTDYLGQTVSLAFKYAGDNGNGWYVDDVEVSVTASISLTGGDWHLIASPLESVSPDDIPGMTTGDYDLYRFEPSATDQEWRNFKNTPFSLQSGQGYLYAHGTDVTLVFDGTSYTSTELVEVSLVYDANDSHKCWNLVGNPYKCKAYLNKECYMLNAEGTGINPEPLPVGTPIPPYTAVFVKAIATGDTVVFTKTVP